MKDLKQIKGLSLWFLVFCIIFIPALTFAKIPQDPEAIKAGEKVYGRHCWHCHGKEGAGDGPAAKILEPRPRNFVAALFKLRTTTSGSLPLDEDLFKTVTKGMPGSAMPSFANLLTEEQRWQVVYYIKTFSEYFSDPELDPYKRQIKIGTPPVSTPEMIKKGREAYEKAECFKCHGNEGRGDGESATDLTDQEGYRILSRNLTKGWTYRGGTDVTDIYTRFTTGMDGTPMPSFVDSLTDEERWDLSLYVKSLIHQRDLSGSMIKAKYISGELPIDPDDQLWNQAESLEVGLTGQVIWKPRWLIPTVDLITVKVLFNDENIAFRLVWDDPFKDTEHDESTLIPPTDTAYPILASDDPDFEPHYMLNKFKLRDSVAIQFSVKPVEAHEKPHFMWGNTSNPVYLLKWNADWQEDAQRRSPVDEMNAKGHKNPPKSQTDEGRKAMGKGVWKDGRWNVVIVRPLLTEDKNDAQFERGKFIPISFQAWNGANSEEGSRMSLSTWNYLMLEGKTPIGVYIYTGIFVAIAYALEWFFTWRARRHKAKRPETFLNFDFSKGY